MNTTYLLLPFTHGLDVCAIEQAVALAKMREATLVPLALIYIPGERRAKGARLEHIQQSKDFLEVTKHKAARYAVPVERFEVFTSNVVQSIHLVADEMACEGILLFTGRKGGVLLQANEVTQLVEMATFKLYIMHLPSNGGASFAQKLLRNLSYWLAGKRKQQDELPQVQECPEDVITIPTGA